jgi:hypothetical protein
LARIELSQNCRNFREQRMANREHRFIEAIADGEARQVLEIINRSIVGGNLPTKKRDVSSDLARGDLAVKNTIGGLDCKNRRLR